MTEWNFKPEAPTTQDVYIAYRRWLDPDYRNPEAQVAWEKVNREEFDTWLAGLLRKAAELAWEQGYRAAIGHGSSGWAEQNPYGLTIEPEAPYAGGTHNEGSFT